VIPLDDVNTDFESSSLSRLEALVKSGVLATAVEQKRLGESLGIASRALSESRLVTSLDALLPAASVAAPRLASRPETTRLLRQILGVSTVLSEAQTRHDLVRLPETLRNAVVRRESVHREIQYAWGRWVEQSFQAQSNLADLLLRFPGTRSVAGRLKSSMSEGLGLKAMFPPTADQVARAKELIQEQQRLLDELRGQDAIQDLLAFLDRVVKGSATLEHVTPKLVEWLRDNSALGSLKINL
jgi:hypothetical protein